ncbi:hypothetical protein NITHO_7110001 [Nitrolancea hollandica Lb]|uniref:Uncharacterized protein n=1 Tax=Nitrolancea hollandica Lb TaxID=1129897 RepID=I4EN20_9BACT|nr:hypothetical protein NITHO_7110001 [Nitrolancea hollandica Lb]
MASSSSVHPHTRGDHVHQATEELALPGSPPHAWGPHRLPLAADRLHRFTPTRVGTTSWRMD